MRGDWTTLVSVPRFRKEQLKVKGHAVCVTDEAFFVLTSD